mmetsp:Transcript_36638/g.42806  ORF Transcript_36638/g.42806 Transcript_36638/m.42806 type:complete len:344 (-) Transcript_36638:101-1132(-)
MLRRTVRCSVHLFNTLLPTNLVKTPSLIDSQEQLTQMKVALQEAASNLGSATTQRYISTLEMCTDVGAQRTRHIQSAFEDIITALRAELYKPAVSNPYQRLRIHEAIMAAGFYQRAANPAALHGEGTRFVLNHFNFDIRRDTIITKPIHDAILADKVPTLAPETEKLVTDLMLLERKLFGHYRFVPSGGRRWFCLGVPLEEMKTEAEVNRLLEMPAFKEAANLKLTRVDNGPKELWFQLELEPVEEPSFLTARDLHNNHRAADCKFTLRINKPPKPLTFRERVTEALLRYWVMWFTFWMMFFMVDEEILALTSLIYLKWKQTRIMRAAAEETGEKVYIATSSR